MFNAGLKMANWRQGDLGMAHSAPERFLPDKSSNA
jgi:hypothetical protein